MGVHTWAYEPEKCDNEYCPCNCDNCSKAYDGEHIPFWLIYEMLVGEKKDDTHSD